jgi:hypothetical protein
MENVMECVVTKTTMMNIAYRMNGIAEAFLQIANFRRCEEIAEKKRNVTG